MKIITLTLCLIWGAVGLSAERNQTWTVDQSLARLRDGNDRFVNGKPSRRDSGEHRRREVSGGQTPYACIITCSDSRVPPEQIFDAGLGDLFVIRVAGNVTSREIVASADYAVDHLSCPVIVVMGHSNCGAVGAALAETAYPEPVNSLIEHIRPSVSACEAKGYDGSSLYDGVIRENARVGAMSLLSGSRAIEEAVTCGRCIVLSAVYDITSGVVHWQSQVAAPTQEAVQAEQLMNKNSKPSEPAPEPVIQETRRTPIASSKSRH